ncbi:MAG: amino acid permease [Phycisphaerales bacterium]|nr:MAG: amino acid permease [Phycisphaerales bacterium]
MARRHQHPPMQQILERPRNLKWYHAGPLLFGDWGTSRLYVLGLAFYFAGHASLFYIGSMALLVIGVGWSYTIVCRNFPDGGGVYSAAKRTHRTVALVGGLLLVTNFSVTAALSGFEAFRYLGLSPQWSVLATITAILLLGGLNAIGSAKAGAFALIVAVGSIATTLVLAAFCLPSLPDAQGMVHLPVGRPREQWMIFVGIVLALSGVEVVANMTGIMVQPVRKTAKKTIWPVVAEVTILNIVLGLAMNAIPNVIENQADHEYRDAMLKVVADHYIGPGFAIFSSFLFALLLLSAVNTAILGLVSIQYAMARDGELPGPFTKLNRFGVPWICLLAACVLACVVVGFTGDLETLAELYAIGVIGAISINLGLCTLDRRVDSTVFERLGMGLVALVLVGIELTIIVTKPHATMFAGSVVVGGLVLRTVAVRVRARRVPVPVEVVPEVEVVPLLAQLQQRVGPIKPEAPRIMAAIRGPTRLVDFALEFAKLKKATLFMINVREVAVPPGEQVMVPGLEEDPRAVELIEKVMAKGEEMGVQVYPIYGVSTDAADVILDFALSYNVSTLLMGVTRELAVVRALRGNILRAIARRLPREIELLIHAA